MMLQPSPLTSVASLSSHVAFALAVLAPALWWRSVHLVELIDIEPERPVLEMLPPSNAPPGAAGGRS